jgi:DnaJ-class molecular chaperone
MSEALRFMGFDDFPTTDSLKQRYHMLALDMHPDRQGGNELKFKLLAKSYKHLSQVCER